jgi:hypothetical protein
MLLVISNSLQYSKLYLHFQTSIKNSISNLTQLFHVISNYPSFHKLHYAQELRTPAAKPYRIHKKRTIFLFDSRSAGRSPSAILGE